MMVSVMGQNVSGAGFALLAFAFFAGHDVVIKLLGSTYSPFQIIFFATLLSFPLITFMLMRDETVGTLRPAHPWWTVLRTLCATLGAICAFYAFTVLPLAQTYAILFSMPLLITLLAIPLLGERVGLHRGAAVLAGLIGVLVVLRPGAEALTLGHLAAFFAAVFNATAAVIMRKTGNDERPVVLLLYPMAVIFILVGWLMVPVYQPMPLRDFAMAGLISVLGFVAGLCLIAAYKRGEAGIVAPMQYSQILWATGYGWFLFSETLDLATVIGASIIIVSGIYIVARENGKGPESQTPVLRTRSRGFGASFRISPFLRAIKGEK
jgi:drug/metabolite transporter (DMT)-like permease